MPNSNTTNLIFDFGSIKMSTTSIYHCINSIHKTLVFSLLKNILIQQMKHTENKQNIIIYLWIAFFGAKQITGKQITMIYQILFELVWTFFLQLPKLNAFNFKKTKNETKTYKKRRRNKYNIFNKLNCVWFIIVMQLLTEDEEKKQTNKKKN